MSSVYGVPSPSGLTFNQVFAGIDLDFSHDYVVDGYTVRPVCEDLEMPCEVYVLKDDQQLQHFSDTEDMTAEDQALEWIEAQLDVLSGILND